jgi:uncharacterized protein YbcV (DUF1398 family)
MNKFILLLVVLILLQAGCIRKARDERNEKRAEKAIEKMMEKAGAENADFDIDGEKFSISTDEGTMTMESGKEVWPKEISADVPEFEYGKIGGVMKQDMPEAISWIMQYDDLSKDAFEKYKTKLAKAGYENSITDLGEMKVMTSEKGDFIVSVRIIEDEGVISVMKRKI